MTTSNRCLFCKRDFETPGHRDRHDCKGVVGLRSSRKTGSFRTPTIFLLLMPLVCLSPGLIDALVGPTLNPVFIIPGLFALVGIFLLLVDSDEPVPDWMSVINSSWSSLESAAVRRNAAVACFVFAAGFTLLGVIIWGLTDSAR